MEWFRRYGGAKFFGFSKMAPAACDMTSELSLKNYTGGGAPMVKIVSVGSTIAEEFFFFILARSNIALVEL